MRGVRLGLSVGGKPSAGSMSVRPAWRGWGVRGVCAGAALAVRTSPLRGHDDRLAKRTCEATNLRRVRIGNHGSLLAVGLAVALAGAGCGGFGGTSTSAKSPAPAPRTTLGTIALNSPAFSPDGALPSRYTCDGANVSPPLSWRDVPAGSVELLLLAIDLDGGHRGAIQWAVAGLPPRSLGIAAGRLPAGAVVGRNSAGDARWGGICDASGRLHHVAFLLYALDRKLGLKAGFDVATVRSGLKDATLARGLTVATYERR